MSEEKTQNTFLSALGYIFPKEGSPKGGRLRTFKCSTAVWLHLCLMLPVIWFLGMTRGDEFAIGGVFFTIAPLVGACVQGAFVKWNGRDPSAIFMKLLLFPAGIWILAISLGLIYGGLWMMAFVRGLLG